MALKTTKQNGSGHKLTPEAQKYVLQALAEKKRGPEINEGLTERFGIEPLAPPTLTGYRERYKSAIARRHRKWVDDVEADVDLATKKVRVREYAKRYWGFYDNCLNGNPEHQFSEKENAVLNNLLEHIRVEMEGKGFTGAGRGTEAEPLVLKVISHVPGE
jgi:hypothetical protein